MTLRIKIKLLLRVQLEKGKPKYPVNIRDEPTVFITKI